MKREKPPMECRTSRDILARDDQCDFFIPGGTVAIVTVREVVLLDKNDMRFTIPRKDFDALVRWYTGAEPKQPRATKGTR